MTKNLWIILPIFFLVSCAQFTPFEDRRREAGQNQTIGSSTNYNPAICYNPLWHNLEKTQPLAEKICEKTQKKAVYKKSTAFSCNLANPSIAFYTCE